MNNKVYIHSIWILLALMTFSCHLIFEEDIKDKDLIINSPTDGYITTQPSMLFWWEELEGADYYSIEVYGIDNGHITTLFVDSNVSGNQFEWTFAPGQYQWSLQAWNSAYYSNKVTLGFGIDSSLNLSTTKVVQVYPVDDSYTRHKEIEFIWQEVYNADRYFIQLKDMNGMPVGSELETDTHYLRIPNAIMQDTLDEGSFEWFIRAENAHSTSLTRSSVFHIDRTVPDTITAMVPQHEANLVDSTIHFSWNSGNDINWLNDSLLIFTDSLFQNLHTEEKLTTPAYQDSLGPGTYYWMIKSIDKAGNHSQSAIFKFEVQ